MSKIQVGLIMGSQSDWSTMKEAADVLSELGVEVGEAFMENGLLHIDLVQNIPTNVIQKIEIKTNQ